MLDFFVALIAFGEITTGLLYTLSGLVFVIHGTMANNRDTYIFRVGLGLMFIIGGLEELADSVVQEGSSDFALWVQGILTAAQVASASWFSWAMVRAGMLKPLPNGVKND